MKKQDRKALAFAKRKAAKSAKKRKPEPSKASDKTKPAEGKYKPFRMKRHQGAQVVLARRHAGFYG